MVVSPIFTSIGGNASTAPYLMQGVPSSVLQIIGTWVGTLQFEATANGTDWFALSVTRVSDGTALTATTANGAFTISNPGYYAVRVRASAWTSGMANVAMQVGGGVVAAGGSVSSSVDTYVYDPNSLSWVPQQQPIIDGGTVVVGTVNQGTGGSNAWKVDGSAVTQPVSGTFYQATQPVSGTVTANAGTNLNTSALALEAGHLATIDTTLTDIETDIDTLVTNSPALVSGRVPVDPSGVTSPVSGTVTARVVGNGGAVVDGVITAATAPANMVMAGGVYNSTEPSPTTGQSVAQQFDAKGRQRTVLMDAAGNTRGANVDANNNLGVVLPAETTKVIGTARVLGNAGAIVDGVVTAATSPANMVMSGGIYNSTEPSPTTGQSTAVQLDAKGRVRTVLMDAEGNTRGTDVDANNNLGVVLPAETTKVVGTVRVLGNVGAVVDGVNTAATAPANGVLGLAIYNSTEPSPTTGQSVGVQVDAKGRARGVIMDAAGNTRGANVNASNQLSVTVDNSNVSTNVAQVGGQTVATAGVNGTLAVGGNVATNVAIGTNPINQGAQAVSSENTAVTATRMVQLVADLVGKLIVLPYANPENFVSGAITTAMTGTTSTSLLAAPASGLRNYITQITISNAHATVGTDVIIQDGNGGTTLYTIPAAAVYGGAVVTFPAPLRQPTTATAIYCANVTTGASTKVSASGYKGA